MAINIEKIDIQAFRGIPSLELLLQGKNLLLKGENGSGKSSLVDAIEFFFTRKISPLEGSQTLSLLRHGPHVNFSCDDVKIEISFNPGNISLERTFATAPTPPANLQAYFDTTQKGTFLLRRAQILEFIQSRPRERFRAIANILGIQNMDKIELNMKGVRDEYLGRVKSNEQQIDEILKDISDILEVEISNEKEIIPILNEKLSVAKLTSINSFADAKRYFEDYIRKIKTSKALERYKLLNDILDEVKKPVIKDNLITEYRNINQKISRLLENEAKKKLLYANILENGKILIDQEEMNTCPLCEQEINRRNLLERIDNRLKTIAALSKEASEIRTNSIPIIDSLSHSATRLETLSELIENFGDFPDFVKTIQMKLKTLQYFIDKTKLAKDLENIFPITELIDENDEIKRLYKSILETIKQKSIKIELTEEKNVKLETVRVVDVISSKNIRLLKIKGKLAENQKLSDLAQTIFQEFSESKKSVVQTIYDSIQSDIDRYYSYLHPNDPHCNIELNVITTRRASTDLRMESFGRIGEDPRALTSEGHLDSLGLCIFLASVREFNPDCSLIILDDVVTTIDRKHRELICKLLLEEFSDSQMIITTHDGIWYEQLRATQRALGQEGHFKNLEITGWNIERGPRITTVKPREARIEDFLNDGNKVSAGTESRRYFEWFLEIMCENTLAPVEFKKSRSYTVGELFNPARNQILKVTRNSTYEGIFRQKFQDLERTRIYGNILSHDNMDLGELSINEVNSFFRAIRSLYEAFSCPTCSHLLKYFRNLRITRCSNPRCTDPLEIRRS